MSGYNNGLEKVNDFLKPLQDGAKGGLELNATRETFNREIKNFVEIRHIRKTGWVSFGFLCFGNLLTLFCFISPGWGWTTEINGDYDAQGVYNGVYGIWYTCWWSIDGAGRRRCSNLRDYAHLSAWAKGAQAMSIIQVIFGFASLLIIGAYLCVPAMNQHMKLLRGYLGVSALTGIFNFFTFGLWGSMFLYNSWWCCNPNEIARELIDYGLYYCFGISVVGAFSYAASSIAASFEMAHLRREEKYSRMDLGDQYETDYGQHLDPRAFFMVNRGFS